MLLKYALAYESFSALAALDTKLESGDLVKSAELDVNTLEFSDFDNLVKEAELTTAEAADLAADIACEFLRKNASAIAAELKPFADQELKGFTEKCAAAGLNPDALLKQAGPVMDSSSELWGKAFGNGIGSNIADFGSYLIPGVGTARGLYDATSDFANVFGKNQTWTQRLGSAASGLGNLGVAALGLIPGAGWLGKLGMKGLKWGAKALKWGNKASKLSGLKGLAGKGMQMIAPHMMDYGQRAVHMGDKLTSGMRNLYGKNKFMNYMTNPEWKAPAGKVFNGWNKMPNFKAMGQHALRTGAQAAPFIAGGVMSGNPAAAAHGVGAQQATQFGAGLGQLQGRGLNPYLRY